MFAPSCNPALQRHAVPKPVVVPDAGRQPQPLIDRPPDEEDGEISEPTEDTGEPSPERDPDACAPHRH
jgi:hypothetical protein